MPFPGATWGSGIWQNTIGVVFSSKPFMRASKNQYNRENVDSQNPN